MQLARWELLLDAVLTSAAALTAAEAVRQAFEIQYPQRLGIGLRTEP